MARMNKVAVWNIFVMVTTMVIAFALVMIFPGTTIGMLAMVLMGGLFLGEKIFKGKDAPDWDEMEKEIGRKAALYGYTLFWVTIILTTTFFPMIKGYGHSISVAYIGFFPLFGAYLLIITCSLSTIYQTSQQPNRLKKNAIFILAILGLLIPPSLTGKTIADGLVREGFAGSCQKDEWHFGSTDNIIAHSTVTMKAIPRTKNKKIYISLPYANGILQKVLLEGEEIESDALGVGEFFIFLPDSMNPNAGNKLEVIWQFPIQNMVVEKENGTCAYRTRARSLIPVDQFNLTAILDDNSGFEVIGKPNQKRWPAIWNMVPRYLTGNFGSCGFHIRKINEEECP